MSIFLYKDQSEMIDFLTSMNKELFKKIKKEWR